MKLIDHDHSFNSFIRKSNKNKNIIKIKTTKFLLT